MRALGLDVGSKTIGVAISDPDGVIASARETLPRRGNEADAQAIVALVLREEVGRVVVGLPLELDGTVGHRARRVQRFVDVLTPAIAAAAPEAAIEAWDERFSTAAAERTLLEADVSRRRRKLHIDALAAQHILQGWLDARERRPA
ncbi:MAG: Holliday junction resolvase RuvX [Myxococcales bacterium]|nr:Holliday junction resolvase RuvX [Myxococcales bacterium]MCB9568385.1 Holliday junction resolvase RuvX [Myxococcales bacterium]MCB9705109.1 Holliday junction resolvase RuvX [Myxococcales bacterium]